MEDSGYLSRVAFVSDRVMGRLGLHGKAFVPMLSGFACAVPAVLATRTIESRRDRLLTMMVVPLMSCSARLPVYVLITATVFDTTRRVAGVLSLGAVVLLGLYALSVATALLAAAVLRRTVLPGPRPPLVLELPPYRLPHWRNLLLNTWQPVRTFLVDAGTIILALTVVLWALLSYPRSPAVDARFEGLRAATTQTLSGEALETQLERLAAQEAGEQLRQSLLGRLGHALEPALEPIGQDWRIGVGILGAFAAREVFVSTLGIVFDIEEADARSLPLRQALRQASWPDGRRLLTPLSGVALLVFFVLACQCMSTLAVVRRESGSWRWPLLLFAYMSVLAYLAALVVYQGGRALGIGLAG
jgi:ferrous iron transport protein B